MGCFEDGFGADEEETLLNTKESGKHGSLGDGGRDISSEEKDDPASEPTNEEYVKGYILLVVGVLAATAGLATAQALNQSIPHWELNGSRFSVTLIVCIGYFFITKCKPFVKLEEAGWVFSVALCYTIISYAVFGKTFYLPLGVSNGVVFTIECVCNLIVSCIVNKRVRWTDLLTSVVCISGAILVTQPPFIFRNPGYSLIHNNGTFGSPCGPEHAVYTDLWNNSSERTRANYTEVGASKNQIFGYTLCFIEAIASVVLYVIVRYKLSHTDLFVLNFWMSLTGVIVSFTIMGFTEIPTLPSLALCCVFFSVHVLVTGMYTIIMTGANQVLSPLCVSLGLMMEIPLTAILQYTVLSGIYPGHANIAEIVGVIVVFSGTIFVPILDMHARWVQTRRETDQ